MDSVFADYLTHADLSKYAVINPNSRTISISSADFAALNKKENAENPTLNPLVLLLEGNRQMVQEEVDHFHLEQFYHFRQLVE